MRGARVFGTTSTEAKAELARQAGADDIIFYTKQDFEAEVKRLTDGRGVDVVYDSVGEPDLYAGIELPAPARDDGLIRAVRREGATHRPNAS